MRDPLRVDFQPDLVLDLENIARRRRDAQRMAAGAGRYQVIPMLAEIGALDDAALDPPAAAIAERPPEADALRPHGEKHAGTALGNVREAISAERETGKADLASGERALEKIGAADETGDEARLRPVVERKGVGDLLDAALVHHHDAVRRDHGLGLVMGHVDGGDAEGLMQAPDLEAHLLP